MNKETQPKICIKLEGNTTQRNTPKIRIGLLSDRKCRKSPKVPTMKDIQKLRKQAKAKSSNKTRNGGQWTEARFKSFIKSTLRSATSRWGPKNKCKQLSKVSRGKYRCAECGKIGPPTLPPPEGKKRRINNAVVDHIDPIIDPVVGFRTWDEVIERMFCELDNLQVLCHKCHTIKTAEERDVATQRRREEKRMASTSISMSKQKI